MWAKGGGRWQYGGYSKQHVQKSAHCADANTNAIKHSVNESSKLGRGEQEWELAGEQGLLLQHCQLLAEASLKRCGNGSGNNAIVDDDAGQIVGRPCECSAVLG